MFRTQRKPGLPYSGRRSDRRMRMKQRHREDRRRLNTTRTFRARELCKRSARQKDRDTYCEQGEHWISAIHVGQQTTRLREKCPLW
jgi:hypothetical protein